MNTEEQKNTIYNYLREINLEDFSEFFEMAITEGDIPLALSFVKAIKEKVEIQMRLGMTEVENMRLHNMNLGDGGFIKCSWQ